MYRRRAKAEVKKRFPGQTWEQIEKHYSAHILAAKKKGDDYITQKATMSQAAWAELPNHVKEDAAFYVWVAMNWHRLDPFADSLEVLDFLTAAHNSNVEPIKSLPPKEFAQ